MKKDLAEKIAVFRYGVIAPVIHDHGQRQMEYFREVSKKSIQCPGKTSDATYSVSSLKSWLRQYRKGGIDALHPATRRDAGVSKKINATIHDEIKTMIDTIPGISASAIYRTLIKQGKIDKTVFTEVTLRNFIRKNELRTQVPSKIGRRKFEMPAINMLWTMDFLHGPHITDSSDHNRKKKVYLCAIIDDHSRLIVGAQFAFAENSLVLATVIKAAMLQYGIPQKLYCDNGAAFSTGFLQLACARINVALIHSKPYDSPSRGKIERFFRTVRQQFLMLIEPKDIASLHALNDALRCWISQYSGTIHSGTEQAPIDRYLISMNHQVVRQLSKHELDQAFYLSIERNVKKDATVSINGRLFEVPAEYIGQKVELRSPLYNLDSMTLFINSQPVCPVKPVNLIENAQKPHTGIHFSKKGDPDDSNPDLL